MFKHECKGSVNVLRAALDVALFAREGIGAITATVINLPSAQCLPSLPPSLPATPIASLPAQSIFLPPSSLFGGSLLRLTHNQVCVAL